MSSLLIKSASSVTRRHCQSACRLQNRFFSRTSKLNDRGAISDIRPPSAFEKKTLVWAGMYENSRQVPSQVSHTQLKVARDWFRVRVNGSMYAFLLIGVGIFVWLGKRAKERGENLNAMGNEFIRSAQKKGSIEREQTTEAK